MAINKSKKGLAFASGGCDSVTLPVGDKFCGIRDLAVSPSVGHDGEIPGEGI